MTKFPKSLETLKSKSCDFEVISTMKRLKTYLSSCLNNVDCSVQSSLKAKWRFSTKREVCFFYTPLNLIGSFLIKVKEELKLLELCGDERRRTLEQVTRPPRNEADY